MLSINLKLDGPFDHLDDRKTIVVNKPISVAYVAGGMDSGDPAVVLQIDLDDGTTIVAGTSLRLFYTAARSMAGKAGWGMYPP
jgi:hypothetical protein